MINTKRYNWTWPIFIAINMLLLSAIAESGQTTNNYFTMLRVVYVPESWVGFYGGSSWERAVEIKTSPTYQLYEAAIWPNAVHLYKFEDPVDFYSYFNNGQAWAQYRESFCLMKFDIATETDFIQRSHDLREAIKQFFAKIILKTPSDHYGIKYSGHGSAWGELFQSQIKREDTRLLLSHIVSILGRKIDFLDLGGNCSQGSVEHLSAFYRYFEYILASSLDVGGYQMDNWTIEKYYETNAEYNYRLLFTPAKSIMTSIIESMGLRRLSWEYSINSMIANQKKESLSLYDTAFFAPLLCSLKRQMDTNPISLQTFNFDLYTYILTLHGNDIQQEFLNFRTQYISNKDFFNWDVDTNGLSMLWAYIDTDWIFNPGDLNRDGFVSLDDAILALQTFYGLANTYAELSSIDVNADIKIGLEEALFVLQKAAVLR